MSFSVPVFNLLASAWDDGHVPDDVGPDWEDVPCQLYVESRPAGLDTSIFSSQEWCPSIIVRFPKLLTALSLIVWVWEVPQGSGRYYRVFFKETMHMGFPNEYLAHFCTQCGDDAIPQSRNVSPYPP